jgi:polycystin 1L2
MKNIHESFQYNNAKTLQGLYYNGDYKMYDGGGYVYKMKGKLSYLIGNLTILQNMGWIDRQTRALFIEFTLYNPPSNTFMICTILFEFLPSGNLVKSAYFEQLNLFNEIGSNGSVKIIFGVIYMLLIIQLLTNHFVMIRSQRGKYFKSFWNYVDWLIIFSSFMSFGIFVYRFKMANQVLKFFKETSGYAFIKLQKINYWNQCYDVASSACIFLASLKFIVMFKFSKRMHYLSMTLRNCRNELIGMFEFFFISWIAFVQILYLFLYNYSLFYSTIVKSMETTLLTILGKFDFMTILNIDGQQKFLVPIFFCAYSFFMIFITVNLFIIILSHSFRTVRQKILSRENDYNLKSFLKTKFNFLRKKKSVDNKYLNYVNSIMAFPDKVDELLYMISKVI